MNSSDRFVKPQVFLIGESRIVSEGLAAFLDEQGVPDWKTDADSDAEKLIEVAGKLCYQSFSTDLNKNLTRTGTRSNHDYIQQGLVAAKHGSVLEHATVNFIFYDVSRVFTHELVRHRHGAYSQVSGRYVRADRLKAFLPAILRSKPEGVAKFEQAWVMQEKIVHELEEIYGINGMTSQADFSVKKLLTSAFRRIIGNGVANHIMATYNHRALRHLIEVRTSRHAEEEIRHAFVEVFWQVAPRYPAIYADARTVIVDGIEEITFAHSKV